MYKYLHNLSAILNVTMSKKKEYVVYIYTYAIFYCLNIIAIALVI